MSRAPRLGADPELPAYKARLAEIVRGSARALTCTNQQLQYEEARVPKPSLFLVSFQPYPDRNRPDLTPTPRRELPLYIKLSP